jgi:TolB-like protein
MTRRLDRLIMVFLALGLAYFAFDKFVLDPARDEAREAEVAQKARSEALVGSYGDKSIAVLAFQDLSPEGDQEYFSDGISEELLNVLAMIPELRVAGKTSAFSFKGKDATIAEIGEVLNVAHVLEGSVRRAGDRLRITVQLVEARTDTHLWSQTYDRDFGDVFAIQDEIAGKVVEELKVRLLGAVPAVRKTDPAAYALYLQGVQAMNRMSSGSPEAAEAFARQALDIDPTYVPAWVLLARAQGYYATWGQATREEARAMARESTLRALALEPENAYANLMLDLQDPRSDEDAQFVADTITRALEREPTSLDFARMAGSFYIGLMRLDRAIAMLEYNLARDPLCTPCLYLAMHAYLYAGQLDKAETTARNYIALTGGGPHTLGVILLLKGENEAAKAQFDSLGENMAPPTRLHGRALGLYAVGQMEEFQKVFAQLREEYSDPFPGAVVNSQGFIAEIYAWTGDKDAAFEWLERALREEGPMRFLHVNPLYRNLHDDPRWLPLLEGIGQAPDQLAAIRFDVKPPG